MRIDDIRQFVVDSVINSRFTEMSKEGRKLLSSSLVCRKIDKGTIILDEGETAKSIIFIGKGMLRQFYYKKGKDVTEHFSYEGW